MKVLNGRRRRSNVKMMVSGHEEMRKCPTGPTLTATTIMAGESSPPPTGLLTWVVIKLLWTPRLVSLVGDKGQAHVASARSGVCRPNNTWDGPREKVRLLTHRDSMGKPESFRAAPFAMVVA